MWKILSLLGVLEGRFQRKDQHPSILYWIVVHKWRYVAWTVDGKIQVLGFRIEFQLGLGLEFC